MVPPGARWGSCWDQWQVYEYEVAWREPLGDFDLLQADVPGRRGTVENLCLLARAQTPGDTRGGLT